MLERATACLKAGARDSLKCAQHAKKAQVQVPPQASPRRSPSTFWTRGACDIDLEISLLGARAECSSAGVEGISLHNDILSVRAKKKQHDKELGTATSTSHSEGPFLEFLYPPHALAWLQRDSSQLRDCHGKRNARRLPKGFAQASRSYSSRSFSRVAEAPSQDGSVTDGMKNSATHVTASDVGGDTRPDLSGEMDTGQGGFKSDSPGSLRIDLIQAKLGPARSGRSQDEQETQPGLLQSKVTTHDTSRIVRELALNDREANEPTEKATEEDDTSPDPLAAAISPADLTDQITVHFDHMTNALETLHTIIAGSRTVHSAEDVSRVWLLYTSLPETAKADRRLMHELLLWFAKVDLETAQAHSISLFWSLPLESRTLTDYEAVLTAFLSRKTYDAVAGVHKEALRNIPTGHRITKKLFQHAVHHNNWQLALAIKDDLDSAFEDGDPEQARQQALFWVDVAEIPDLPQKAASLVRKCLWFQRRKRPRLDKFTALSARLSEEAIRQTLLSAPSNRRSDSEKQATARPTLVKLFDSIIRWSPKAPQLLEEFLIKVLELNKSEDQYRQVRGIVSYVYGHYRQMQGVHFPSRMLRSLLSRIIHQAAYVRDMRFTKHSLSIEVVVEDWQEHYAILSRGAVKRLMTFYARQGMLGPFDEYYAYLRLHFPAFRHQMSVLWTLIYVHARRGDSDKAQEAFDHVDKFARLNDEIPNLKCWNTLMHAYGRADDLVGGLKALSRMIDVGKLSPDARTIHPLLEMLARRGDAEGITDLLQQYDSLTGELHMTGFIGSRMRALIHSGEVPQAEQLLKETVKKVRLREIAGTLTECFNILIAAYAGQRDLEGTMRTYRWMKAENVRLDRYTYSPLILALIHFRQTPAAYTIMTKVMRKEGFRPTAIHYAMIMAGFVKQGMYDRAIWLHQKMTKMNIRPSLATRSNYMNALAMKQEKEGTAFSPEGEPAPLMHVINELRDALLEHDGSEIASKDPVFGHDPTGGGEDVREHFVAIIFAHGKHRCFEAVHELFRMFVSESEKIGKSNAFLPMRILVAMMDAHLRNGEYDQVEAYWNIAKDNADHIAPKIAIPDYREASPSTSVTSRTTIASPVGECLPGASGSEDDRAEVGFESSQGPAVQDSQTLLPAPRPRIVPQLSPGFKYILTRPLRYYLRALAAQDRIADVLTTFTSLVRRGYAFDTITWNRLIEYLCTAKPPLALLAFTFTERFLIPNFPGWTRRSTTRRLARKSAESEGLQFIRARYLSYDVLVPQYRTMVFLTAALLKLRRMEATGASRANGDIGRFVGTIRQIEAMAPKTLDAVNSMPQVEHDKYQHTLLRSDEANKL